MELDQLHIFIEVARRGRFAAVAKDRDIDPSSVSRAIASLEEELGTRLFQRTTRRLSLTEAGARYLARVEPLIQELALAGDLARHAASQPSGNLRMTASVTFGVTQIVPLLPDFRQQYPEIRIELVLTDQNVDLVAERLDLAVRLAPQVEGDLVAQKWLTTRYRVCAAPAYLNSAPPLQSPQDLQDHDCLLFALPGYRTRWRFRTGSESHQVVQVQGKTVISNALALLAAARGGMGPVLLADWLVREDISRGQLVDVFPNYEVTATTFDTGAWLVYPSRSFLPQKARAMIDFLKASSRHHQPLKIKSEEAQP